MKVEQIDVVDLQPLQAGVARSGDGFWPIVCPYSAVLGSRNTTLGRQEYVLAPTLDALSDEALVGTVLINGRGIQMIDAEIEGTKQRGSRFHIIALTVPAHHAHAAKAEGRDVFSGVTELAPMHPPDDTRA
jgi:hypothetical protein